MILSIDSVAHIGWSVVLGAEDNVIAGFALTVIRPVAVAAVHGAVSPLVVTV
jgi:hypothetical protein